MSSRRTETVDAAMIGTGPLALFEGLRLARQGARVVFIDRAASIGGSWRTPTVFGFRNVEVGVHLIEARPKVNAWLRQITNGQITKSGSAIDFGLVGQRRIPMNMTRVILHGLVSAKAALRGNWDNAQRTVLSAVRSARNLCTPMYYPDAGFSSVVHALRKDLETLGAQFFFDTSVERLCVTGNGVDVQTDRQTLKSASVLMSSRAHAQIEGFSDLRTLVRRDSTYSYVLHLSGPAPRFDGYVEIIGDRSIKRVRNIGGFVRPAPPTGEALICVQTRKELELPEQERAAMLVARLAERELLDRRTRAVAQHCDIIQLATLTNAAVRQIESTYAPRIRVLRSTDFADCLETRLGNPD